MEDHGVTTPHFLFQLDPLWSPPEITTKRARVSTAIKGNYVVLQAGTARKRCAGERVSPTVVVKVRENQRQSIRISMIMMDYNRLFFPTYSPKSRQQILDGLAP